MVFYSNKRVLRTVFSVRKREDKIIIPKYKELS